jgi:hypothetical protein
MAPFWGRNSIKSVKLRAIRYLHFPDMTLQTFVGGVIAYKALARPQFSQLQQKIFPVYFGIQTALPVVLALTYPGSGIPLGVASGFSGALAEVNKWSVLVPLATIFVTSVANPLFLGPATTRVMRERKVQGKSYLGF